jgi:hypothetical protein
MPITQYLICVDSTQAMTHAPPTGEIETCVTIIDHSISLHPKPSRISIRTHKTQATKATKATKLHIQTNISESTTPIPRKLTTSTLPLTIFNKAFPNHEFLRPKGPPSDSPPPGRADIGAKIAPPRSSTKLHPISLHLRRRRRGGLWRWALYDNYHSRPLFLQYVQVLPLQAKQRIQSNRRRRERRTDLRKY